MRSYKIAVVVELSGAAREGGLEPRDLAQAKTGLPSPLLVHITTKSSR